MGQFRRYALTCAAWVGGWLAAGAVPAPDLTIELPGKFGEFRLINHGAPVQLDSTVQVQQRIDGKWQETHVANLYLMISCQAAQPPRCVSLASGANLQPVAWSGNYCSSQCPTNCNLDGPVPPGIYRFVVTSCGRRYKFFSAPFEKKAPGDIVGSVRAPIRSAGQ
ncbi:MAG: hypothetical protein LAQ69_40845 [Acidobacteriia bacterium]|nr:hypothetical protein [Terriglobia bacterium]